MKILFFTKGDANVASSRQRAFYVARALTARGYTVSVHAPNTHASGLSLVRTGDVVVLQKLFFKKTFLFRLWMMRRKIRFRLIFDFDDAVYLHSPLLARFLCRAADAVTVGNETLATWARPHARSVYLVPTALPFEVYARYGRNRRKKNETFVIGWIGDAAAHIDNLRLLVPVFSILIQKNRPFLFHLVGANGSHAACAPFRALSGLHMVVTDTLEWSDDSIVAQTVGGFDVGVMPLLDTPWNEGKCLFKAIEYMACGVVPVASPLSGVRTLIEDGRNGFMRDSVGLWVEAIERLMDDEQLSASMGSAAQETVRLGYSYEATLPLFLAAVTGS